MAEAPGWFDSEDEDVSEDDQSVHGSGNGSPRGNGSPSGSDTEVESSSEEPFKVELIVKCSQQNILHTMYNNPDFCDMEFIVNNGKRFPVNRAVVSAASPELKAMLLGSYRESTSKEVTLPENEICFELVLKHIYGFEFTVEHLNCDEVLELLRLSDFYNIPTIKESLTNYLSSDYFLRPHLALSFKNLDTDAFKRNLVGNFFKLANAAHKYDMVELERRLKSKLCMVPIEFVDNVAFLHTPYNLLLHILRTNLIDAPEITKLFAIFKWFHGNVKFKSYYPDNTEPTTSKEIINEIKETNDSENVAQGSKTEGHINFTSKNSKQIKMTVTTCPDELKSLLNEIEFSRISLLGYFKLYSINPFFHKYMDSIDLGSFFTVNVEPKKKQLSKSFHFLYSQYIKDLNRTTEKDMKRYEPHLLKQKYCIRMGDDRKMTIEFIQHKGDLLMELVDREDTSMEPNFRYIVLLHSFNPLEKTLTIKRGKARSNNRGHRLTLAKLLKCHFLNPERSYYKNGKLKIELIIGIKL